ncbi:MAG: aldo/keto reductase, partial [Candidatus Eremiobacteraeota bacterium]|nr:aldo/keto reductase [Candidatus Eremiobacteraeota bacterium]
MKRKRFGPPSLSARGTFEVSVVGQGSWPLPNRDALRRGIDLGMTHIDTAEMYGGGRSEEIVGEAIAPYPRASLFIVSKVLPSNGSASGVARACERSLRRLGTDYLDCYLLHWRGDVALEETMPALERLVDEGKIRSLGVSNLDPWDLREAAAALRSAPIACNQLLYNLGERTPEDHELLWARENESAFVAYTPLARPDDARGERLLAAIARERGVTAAAVALAFLARDPAAFVIPKANSRAHVEANAAAGDLELSAAESAEIDAAYPRHERVGALPTN